MCTPIIPRIACEDFAPYVHNYPTQTRKCRVIDVKCHHLPRVPMKWNGRTASLARFTAAGSHVNCPIATTFPRHVPHIRLSLLALALLASALLPLQISYCSPVVCLSSPAVAHKHTCTHLVHTAICSLHGGNTFSPVARVRLFTGTQNLWSSSPFSGALLSN